jgi:hypothetical protein
MDINALKQRLGEISGKNKKNNNLWKPNEGKQIIRLVPCKDNPDNPFNELRFHYGLNGKNWLSPATYGRPDPVLEFANKLKQTGNSDDYNLAKDFFPKMRIYAPVIVRGEEGEGVRYWGFGKKVYQELLGFISDEDYGDITDMKEGNDITVEYIPKEQSGKNFPETVIRVKPKKTVVGDSDVVDAIKNQPSIKDIFDEKSYDELKDALESHINPEAGEVEDTDDEVVVVEQKVTETSKDDDAPAVSSKAPKAASSNVGTDFDKLFDV